MGWNSRASGYLDRTTWDRVVSGLKIEVTAATDTDPAVERDLTVVELEE